MVYVLEISKLKEHLASTYSKLLRKLQLNVRTICIARSIVITHTHTHSFRAVCSLVVS